MQWFSRLKFLPFKVEIYMYTDKRRKINGKGKFKRMLTVFSPGRGLYMYVNCLYISLLLHFIFLASSTGRFPLYFFVPCLLRDSENDLLKGRLLLKHSEGIESNWT